MFDQQRALVVGCSLLLLTACKKDGDNTPPSVNILAPAAGSTVSLPDTIMVRVQLSDNELVEHLTVGVADAVGNPIGPFVGRHIGSSSATVDLVVPITNERIESGSYRIIARASDGGSDGTAFSTLVLNAVPLRLRSVFIAPPNAVSGPVPLVRIDSTGAQSIWTTLNDLGGTSIDLDHVYTTGWSSDALVRYGINSGNSTTLWTNQSSAGSRYFFGTKVDPTDERFYVGTRDGYLRGWNNGGTASFTAVLPSGWYSECTSVLETEVVSAAVNSAGTERRLITFDRTNGVLLAQFTSDIEPVELYAKDASHVLVFGNRTGSGTITDRNAQTGGAFEMRSFPNEAIHAVARIDANNFVIALPSGLKRFNSASNSVVGLAGSQANALAYDAATGALFVGVGQDLLTLDAISGTVVATTTLPMVIGRILPLDNR